VAAPDPKPEPDRAAEEREKRLAKALDDAKVQEANLFRQEREWLREFVEAQRRLLQVQERLRTVQRLQEDNTDTIRSERDALAARIRKMEEVLADNKKDAERLAQWKDQVSALTARLRDHEERRSAELFEARLAVIQAEEEVRLVERQQAAQRARLQARVDAAHDRVRQLQDDAPPADPADRRVRGLEKKLDEVLRELAELRREMRKGRQDKE
jgi:hypothetical protein